MTTNVLLLVNAFTRGGGAERLAIDLACSRAHGLRFVVCAIGDSSSEEARSVRAELADGGATSVCIASGGRIGRARSLADVVSRHRVQVAHLHALSTAALPFLALRVPHIYTFHAESLVGPHARAFHALEILLARSAKRCVVVSRAMLEVASRRTRIPRGRLVVIANGVDVDRLRAQHVSRAAIRARYGVPLDAPLVTVLARLDGNKRQDLVLEAVARLPDRRTNVVLAGSLTADPHWVEQLRATARALGIDSRVRFPGIVADAPSLLSASDVLVAASASESFGIAPVEGMVLSVPVVASDIPAHRESTNQGSSCVLFPSGDAAALAGALERVLGGQHGLDLARIANDAAARYGRQRVADEHATLYRAVAENAYVLARSA